LFALLLLFFADRSKAEGAHVHSANTPRQWQAGFQSLRNKVKVSKLKIHDLFL